eukprot:356431-Chlamydomonas_euryale.AAC.1
MALPRVQVQQLQRLVGQQPGRSAGARATRCGLRGNACTGLSPDCGRASKQCWAVDLWQRLQQPACLTLLRRRGRPLAGTRQLDAVASGRRLTAGTEVRQLAGAAGDLQLDAASQSQRFAVVARELSHVQAAHAVHPSLQRLKRRRVLLLRCATGAAVDIGRWL